MTVGMARNTNIAQMRPDDAGPDAQAQEMPLELAGDEAVGGADEVQHLDDLAVGGHGALGGGMMMAVVAAPTSSEDGEAAEGEGAGDGADLLLPAAMVVQRYALEPLFQGLAQAIELGGSVAVDLDGNQSRDRQGAQRIGLAEPWLEQLRRIGNAQRPDGGNAGLCGRKLATSATTLSMSARSRASICTVTSLAMSRSQAEADWFIM